MKHFLTSLLIVLCTGSSVYAQDILTKTNGEQLKVVITEVSKKKVKYVRPGTQIPVYTLSTKEISHIDYLNGDRDTFNQEATAKATEAAEAQPKQESKAAQKGSQPLQFTAPAGDLYCIGDIYDKDGVKGLVITTSDNGTHGTIVSLDEACLAWCSLPRKAMKSIGTDDRNDGRVNMALLRSRIADEGLSWSDFPAAAWCKEHGEGWYLPAVNEVWLLGTVFCGGSRSNIKKRISKSLNSIIRNQGGEPLNRIMYYLSSTEAAERRSALFSHLNGDLPYIGDCGKEEQLFVRAFYRF